MLLKLENCVFTIENQIIMKILVPTDFSDNALKAALYASEIAKRTKATLYFLHAMELGHEKITQPFSLHEKYNQLLIDQRKIDIETFKKSVLSIYPNINTKTELSDGDAVKSILEFSEKYAIDLIVMGTKGAGKIKEQLVGTVAAAVTGKSKVPVFVVPEEYEAEKPDGILFATNHFEKNKKVLETIIRVAKLFSATVYAVVFVDTDKTEATGYSERKRNISYYLRYLKKNYPNIDFRGEVIEGKEFESAIELFHARHETDIAAMITYPKGFWEKVLKKSVTKKMIYHSHIPILAIPAIEEN